MKLVHLHHDMGWDAASPLTFDPDWVDGLDEEISEYVETGLACRFIALTQGVCPCESVVIQLNRAARRRAFPGRKAEFDAYCQHMYSCPAVGVPTRQWAYEKRAYSL